MGKTHGKPFFAERVFRRALWKSRTVKLLFAVYPKNVHDKISGARQRGSFR
jgi:hypothetical protein